MSEEQIESVIENMDVHCFKRDLKPEEFINTINKVCIISDNLGIPVEGMPEYMAQEQEKLNKIRQEIIDLQMTKMQVLQDHNVTINTLQEYEKNKPIADYLAATKRELEKVKKERDSYRKGLEHDRFWKRKEEQYTWSVLATEYDKANRDLGFGTNNHLNAGNLKNMVMDVYYYPSKYVQAISQMMNTYNLDHK